MQVQSYGLLDKLIKQKYSKRLANISDFVIFLYDVVQHNILVMDHNNLIECGGFYFIHNFDSGNLGHVERVPTELIGKSFSQYFIHNTKSNVVIVTPKLPIRSGLFMVSKIIDNSSYYYFQQLRSSANNFLSNQINLHLTQMLLFILMMLALFS